MTDNEINGNTVKKPGKKLLEKHETRAKTYQ